MPRGKRSKAATKGLTPKKITSAQRRARKINIEVARRAKKTAAGSGRRKPLSKDVAKLGASYEKASIGYYTLRSMGVTSGKKFAAAKKKYLSAKKAATSHPEWKAFKRRKSTECLRDYKSRMK